MRGTFEEPPTGLIPWFSKIKGNTYATIAASPLPLQGKPMQAQDVARRISGAIAGEVFAQVKTYQVPSQTHLPHVYLSFSSPPLHPCRFIRLLLPNLLLSFPFAFPLPWPNQKELRVFSLALVPWTTPLSSLSS